MGVALDKFVRSSGGYPTEGNFETFGCQGLHFVRFVGLLLNNQAAKRVGKGVFREP